MKIDDFKKLNFSVLGQESSLEGDFKFAGDVIVNCKLKGTLTITDHGKLILERNADVEGQIYCQDIEVFGEFRGGITAAGTLSVRSSAQLSGRLQANKLSVFPGAQINIEGHTEEEHVDNP